MILYDNKTAQLIQLPAKINEVGTTVNGNNFQFLEKRLNKVQIFEFEDSRYDNIVKYNLTPTVTVNSEGVASYNLNEVESSILSLDWHEPEYFKAEVGRIHDKVCQYYWFRIIFDEDTCLDVRLDAFSKRLGRRKAPYIADKNGGSAYYQYLHYLLTSDGFGVDENGKVTLGAQLSFLEGFIEQLGEAEEIDGKIYLKS